MKKSFIIISILFFSIGITVNAQNSETDQRENLSFGVKAGLNYSNVFDAKGEEFVADPKIGFAGGVFLSIPVGKYLGVQPELMFSQKGFKASGMLLGRPYNFTRTTNYLDIPILLSLKPSEFISIFAGPQFSYLLKQTDTFTSDIIDLEQETEFENDNIRYNTLGVVIGVDVNISDFIIGARAAWDLQSNLGDGTSTTPRYKNVLYQLTLGYIF